MATKKRVRVEGEGAPATQVDSGDEGADEGALVTLAELRAVHKRLAELKKESEELKEKLEAVNHVMWDFDAEGKKYHVMKKALGMSNFHHAWIKHAEEVMPALQMPEKVGNGFKK